MKLLTITSVLLPALFGGCAALPAGSDGYAASPYYAPRAFAAPDGYQGSPYYASAPPDYAVPAYYATSTSYGAPAYYDPPLYYAPSLALSASRNPHGGAGQQNRAAPHAGVQQTPASRAVAPALRMQQGPVPEDPAARSFTSPAREQQRVVPIKHGPFGIAPQARAQSAAQENGTPRGFAALAGPATRDARQPRRGPIQRR